MAKFFVYHEPVNFAIGYGIIRAVSPVEMIEFSRFPYLVVEEESIRDIIDGSRSASHYCVIGIGETAVIAMKSEFDVAATLVIPHVIRIPNLELKTYDVAIEIDHIEQRYKVKIDPLLFAELNDNGRVFRGKLFEELRIYLVDARNSAFLLDQIVIKADDILNEPGYVEAKFLKPLTNKAVVMVTNFFTRISCTERVDDADS